MDKPIQVTESSNFISPDAAGMANRSQGEEGGDTFTSIIARSTAEDTGGTEGGESLPASGKKLPEQPSGISAQQNAGSSLALAQESANVFAKPDVTEEVLPADALNQPQPATAQLPSQPASMPDGLAIDNATTAYPGSITERPVNSAEPVSATLAGQQLQGQMPNQRMVAPVVPGNLSVADGPVMQDELHAVDVASVEVTAYLKATVGNRVSSDTEPVANPLREAVQQAIVSQAPGRDLKQFLQQHGNHQAASNLLPVTDHAETQAIPFLQTVSDNALLMPSARISVPVGQPGWGQALGTQVAWFVSQNINAASLRLNPQHLGPMEVEVSLDGDKASVAFASQHGMVRDALESAIPRLREMLSENGLNLVNVNISQQGMSRQQGQGTLDSRHGAGIAAADSDASEEASVPGVRQAAIITQGLVDFYA